MSRRSNNSNIEWLELTGPEGDAANAVDLDQALEALGINPDGLGRADDDVVAGITARCFPKSQIVNEPTGKPRNGRRRRIATSFTTFIPAIAAAACWFCLFGGDENSHSTSDLETLVDDGPSARLEVEEHVATESPNKSAAGDINGDGLADLIVGTPEESPPSQHSAGAAYVVFGTSDGSALAHADIEAGATGTFAINCAHMVDSAGHSFATTEDGSISVPGGAYVVFGKTESAPFAPFHPFAAIERASEQADFSMSIGGDVNGDGLNDVVIRELSRATNVAFGKESAISVLGAAFPNWTASHAVMSSQELRLIGEPQSSVGTTDGDGLTDLVVSSGYIDAQDGTFDVVFERGLDSVVRESRFVAELLGHGLQSRGSATAFRSNTLDTLPMVERTHLPAYGKLANAANFWDLKLTGGARPSPGDTSARFRVPQSVLSACDVGLQLWRHPFPTAHQSPMPAAALSSNSSASRM